MAGKINILRALNDTCFWLSVLFQFFILIALDPHVVKVH